MVKAKKSEMDEIEPFVVEAQQDSGAPAQSNIILSAGCYC
jgi:hypothetical protein